MNDTRPQVLVLGANGRFGQAACAAFLAAGWRVLAHRRTPAAGSLQSPAATLRHVHIPLDDTQALAHAAAGSRVVVYAVNPPYTDWATQMLPLARAGMAVAERLGARFMLPGNVYGFGSEMPERLLEDTPERPDTRKGHLRQQLEAQLATHPGLRSVVLRAGDFFGSGRGGWFDAVVARQWQRGRLTWPGPLETRHAWTYVPDLARAFVQAAEGDEALPRFLRLHVPGHNVTGHAFVSELQAAAAELGVAPTHWRIKPLNWTLLNLAGWLWPMGRELAEMRYLWQRPHGLEAGSKLLAFSTPTPLRTALRHALAAIPGAAKGFTSTPPAQAEEVA